MLEGFDYCFKHYSSFEDVKDENFHKLRKKYIKVYKYIPFVTLKLIFLNSISIMKLLRLRPTFFMALATLNTLSFT